MKVNSKKDDELRDVIKEISVLKVANCGHHLIIFQEAINDYLKHPLTQGESALIVAVAGVQAPACHRVL